MGILRILIFLLAITLCVTFTLLPKHNFGRYITGSRCQVPVPSVALSANQKSLEELIYNPPDYLLRLVSQFPERRLSISDVVAGSGKTFYGAKRDLMALASLTGATLEVTHEGELLFIFPYDVRGLVQRKSVARQTQVVYDKTSPIALNMLKASFGVMLGISLVIVFFGLAVLQSNGDVDNDSRRESHDNDSNKSVKPNSRYRQSSRIEFSLSDFFFVEDLTRIFTSSSPLSPSQQPLNFLEACYSFLFGDGDVNRSYRDELIIQAANYIRANQGLVIAEELTPFIYHPPALPRSSGSSNSHLDKEDAARLDESFLLPLVLQLNGNPIVSEHGHVLYHFEELMKSPNLPSSYLTYPSLRSPPAEPAPAPENYVTLVPLEVEPQFSRARTTQLAKVGLLAMANFVGVAALGSALVDAGVTARRAGELVGFLRMAYPPLAVYALGFVCVPLVRFVYHVGWAKSGVRNRNARRTLWVQQLRDSPTPSLREKLLDKTRWLESRKKQAGSSGQKGLGAVVFSSSDSPALQDDSDLR
eukprot:gene40797-49755_t